MVFRTDVRSYDIDELYEFADKTGILERHKQLLAKPFHDSQVRYWRDLQVRWQGWHFWATRITLGQTIPRQSGEILTRSTSSLTRLAFWSVTNSCWPNHSTTVRWDIDEIYKFIDKTGILECKNSCWQTIPRQSGEILMRSTNSLTKPSFWRVTNSCWPNLHHSQVRYWWDLQVRWQNQHFGASQTAVGQTIPRRDLQVGWKDRHFWSFSNSCWPNHSTTVRWDIDEIYKFAGKTSILEHQKHLLAKPFQDSQVRYWWDLQVRWQDRHFGALQTAVGQTIPRQSGEILTRSTSSLTRPAFWSIRNICWPNHSTPIWWDIAEITSTLTRPAFWSVQTAVGQTIPRQAGEILTRSTSPVIRARHFVLLYSTFLTRQVFWNNVNSCSCWPSNCETVRTAWFGRLNEFLFYVCFLSQLYTAIILRERKRAHLQGRLCFVGGHEDHVLRADQDADRLREEEPPRLLRRYQDSWEDRRISGGLTPWTTNNVEKTTFFSVVGIGSSPRPLCLNF